MRTENVELTVLCLVHTKDKFLLQNRIKKDWKGFTLPGGHIERNESIVDAVIREIKEETGLTIYHPRLCGIKQFPIKNGRYLVFCFETNEFTGELVSSSEGNMQWVKISELANINLVEDFSELIQVMLNENLTEFQYVLEQEDWKVIIK